MFCRSDIINFGNLHHFDFISIQTPTDNGKFMSPWEAKWMGLSGSAFLVGKKGS